MLPSTTAPGDSRSRRGCWSAWPSWWPACASRSPPPFPARSSGRSTCRTAPDAPAASIRAVRPIRSASGFTCGLVIDQQGHRDVPAVQQAGQGAASPTGRAAGPRTPPRPPCPPGRDRPAWNACDVPLCHRCSRWQRRVGNVVRMLRLGRDAGHVEQCDRAVAGQRGAEMFQSRRSRARDRCRDHRHLPVVAGETPDDAAQRAPIVQVARRVRDVDQQGCAAMRVQMIAVARRAAGQPGGERRRSALEVGARRRARCCNRSPRRCRHTPCARRAPAA